MKAKSIAAAILTALAVGGLSLSGHGVIKAYASSESNVLTVTTQQLADESQDDAFCWKKFDKAYITFCVDDGNVDINQVADLFERNQVPLCCAIIPARLDWKTLSGETVGEVGHRVVQNGGEILAHNAGILDANSKEEDFERFFVQSKQELVDAGFDIDGIILSGDGTNAPFTVDFDKCVRYMRPLYQYSDAYGRGTGAIQYDHTRTFTNRNHPVSNTKLLINNAVREKAWISVAFHGFETYGDASEEILQELIDYVKALGKDKIAFTTFRELHQTFGTTKRELARAAQQERAITITMQPKALGSMRETAQFSVKAEGDGHSCQWQISDDEGKTWSNSAVQTPVYTTTLTNANNGRRMRCVISDKYGHSVTSYVAVMWMSGLKITTQPKTAVVMKRGTVQFTVKAGGDGLSYQWQISDDAGKTWRNSAVQTPVYTATLTNANNGRRMRCVVSDKYGNAVISNTVTMWTSGLRITMQPKEIAVDSGSTVQCTVKASGDGLSYQWQISDDAGKTWRNSAVRTAVYTTTLTDANNGRLMRCVVSDKYGNAVTSDAAAMRIYGK